MEHGLNVQLFPGADNGQWTERLSLIVHIHVSGLQTHAPNLSIASVAVTTPFRQVTTPFLLQLCFDFCQTPLRRVLPLDFYRFLHSQGVIIYEAIVSKWYLSDWRSAVQPASFQFWKSPSQKEQNWSHLRASKSISLWAKWTPNWRAMSCWPLPSSTPEPSYMVTYCRYGHTHTRTLDKIGSFKWSIRNWVLFTCNKTRKLT